MGTTHCQAHADRRSIDVGELKEGKLLKGRYEVIKIVDETPESIIYIAKDKGSPQSLISVKEIKPKMKGGGKNTRLELAQKEAQILASLNHHGIPKYIDFFPGVDAHFMLTEYMEGDQLDSLLAARGGTPFDGADILPWMFQLCDIISYLHSQDKPVIVRGIQPSSLLVTFKGELKLMNFGMARQFDEVKSIDTVFVWNPGFTSPEQYGKQKSDNRSDIYSFGATFYNLLTCQDVGSLNFNFPPINQFNPRVSPALEKILMKCLAVNPDDRYQVIFEVKSELITYEKGGPSEPAGARGGPAQKKTGDTAGQSGSFFSKLFGKFKK
jgi:serine/threonine protein kinase